MVDCLIYCTINNSTSLWLVLDMGPTIKMETDGVQPIHAARCNVFVCAMYKPTILLLNILKCTSISSRQSVILQWL